MSIHLMTTVWKLPMPSGQKLVLLALCDNANDQGECYPSVSMLKTKCSMSERSIFNHIDWLEKSRVLIRENRVGRSTIYHIDPCKFCTPANSAPLQNLHPTPANSAPLPLQNLHPTPANSAPITIIEPSIEPSKESSIKVAREKKDEFVLPDWIEERTWHGFIEMRKMIKKPLTLQAMELTVKALEKMRGEGEDVNAVLEQSIMRSWQGVFPLKNKQRQSFADRKAKEKEDSQAALDAWARGEQPGSKSTFIEGEFGRA